MAQSPCQFKTVLRNNAYSVASFKITFHAAYACRQNAASASFFNCFYAAVINNNFAHNARTERQPALAELQTVFFRCKQRADFLAV